ncbi:ATP-binding protein [Rhodohalobacter sp. 8-1]|uniref:ATP-binding protein n=1 Tax=Rhodohalobacter sp. 8-1 TaxID=3131972 RepID=UPI0030ED94A2
MKDTIQRSKKNAIIELLENFPVVALTGARQVGKTTLAKHIAKEFYGKTLHLDLESPRDEGKLADPELFFERFDDHLIIIDEIQRRPDLFSILRSVIDRDRRPGRFLLLGSASPVLIRESSESLAGRITYEELTPFTWPEISAQYDIPRLWIQGGFPEAFLTDKKSYRQRWLQDYIRTLIERDLPMLGLNTDLGKLKNFLKMLAHQNGQLLNQENLARSVGVSSPTISKYLDYLEYAYIIRRLQPWHRNVKKRLVKSPKVYIRDTGVLHALLNIDSEESLRAHPAAGGSWEGFVLQQILATAPDTYSFYFYRTHQGAEADLVVVKDEKPLMCIDIKLNQSPKPSKGFHNVIEDNQTTRNAIITPGSDRYPVHEHIDVVGIEKFLENWSGEGESLID